MLIRFTVKFTRPLTGLNGLTFEVNSINQGVILLEGFRGEIANLFCSYQPDVMPEHIEKPGRLIYQNNEFWEHCAGLATDNMDWCPEIREIKGLDKQGVFY